jgi:hypothetical protein
MQQINDVLVIIRSLHKMQALIIDELANQARRIEIIEEKLADLESKVDIDMESQRQEILELNSMVSWHSPEGEAICNFRD